MAHGSQQEAGWRCHHAADTVTAVASGAAVAVEAIAASSFRAQQPCFWLEAGDAQSRRSEARLHRVTTCLCFMGREGKGGRTISQLELT